jgi:transcriptional regulator with XRE-family HTH domain
VNDLIRTRRLERGWTQQQAAEAVCVAVRRATGHDPALDAMWIGRLERGRIKWPNRDYRAGLREVYGAATDAELGLSGVRKVRGSLSAPSITQAAAATGTDDEYDALELARRVAASDVGEETIQRLETVTDDLAVAYPVSQPQDLLERIRLHLGYVSKLLDGRKTLDEHRRLMVVGGWLSLLGATLHVDLKQDGAAVARLRTASQLATQAEHDEIRAWCLETSAWRVLTVGDYPRAVKLAQAAQSLAPAGSSAQVQATAQEGRAWARLGQAPETYDAMRRVNALVAARTKPDRPGHHYHYDPEKVTAYSATTLAWLGDPAAETFARQLITNLEGRDLNGKWPRRLASANLDLALTLLVTDRLDEACASTLSAISSGYVAPSNRWRALEVVAAVEARKLPEARELREAYEGLTAG